MQKVDFIIAGSAKSGTTALTHMLDQHPSIHTSEIKETNFFVNGFEETRHLLYNNGKRFHEGWEEHDIIDSWDKYQALYSDARSGQLLGEASPWYLLNDQVPQRIVEHNPNTKVIAILRNPTDVAFANFVHQVRDRAEALSMEQLDSIFDESRYTNPDLHPFARHLDLPRYGQHLPAYIEGIAPENFHLMIYEEFRSNRRAALSGLFEFLGVSDQVNIEVEQQVNISGLPKSEKLQDFIQGSMVFKKAVGLVIPKKPRRRVRAYIEALNTGKKAVLPDEYREQFDELYSEDVAYVERLLGRSISAWQDKRLTATEQQLAEPVQTRKAEGF